MSNVFGITVSALQAFQNAINVTSNNIANASTPGYDKETVILTEALPQANGSATVGNGVAVSGVARAYSAAAATQLNVSQSSLGGLTALQDYTSQIDNLFGTTGGGLSTALQSYYSAWSSLSNDPTSTSARQSLLSAAQSLAQSFQTTSSQLNAYSSDINNRVTDDVTQINSIANSITTLNKQIVTSTGQDGDQQPNELLDQRDQLVSQLSSLVNVTTTTDSDGALNVFVGSGQPLVLQGVVTPLTTVADQYNATQLDISSKSNNGNVINGDITGGDLGGLLQARTQAIQPALNGLGQIATALSTSANTLQAQGVDLSGNFGSALFSIDAPAATASSQNTGTAVATASISNVGALTTDNYTLTYKNGAYSIKNGAGTAVSFTGTGSVANPFQFDGLSVSLSATPASNDSFLILPTAQAASSIAVALTDPAKIAAAGPVQANPGASNTGSATIAAPTVLNVANAALRTTATIAFTSATTYTVNGAGSYAYTSGGNIALNGWQTQISGSPKAGDTFTVSANTAGSGDNRNALAAAAQQTTGVLSDGTTSVTGAVSAMITGIGSTAQQVNTAQAAQSTVNTQASADVQSSSGVNLDEEAADLLKWQQSYQAAAQALTIANSLFTTLISSVNGTYS